MIKVASETITLGADVGGRDADSATVTHVLGLRKLLASTCVGPYSSVFDEIGLVLRIDGCIEAWERRGVDAVVIRNSRRYATVDIYIPREAWAHEDGGANFRQFLAAGVKEAIEAVVMRALKKKIDIQHAALLNDVGVAIEVFLNQDTP